MPWLVHTGEMLGTGVLRTAATLTQRRRNIGVALPLMRLALSNYANAPFTRLLFLFSLRINQTNLAASWPNWQSSKTYA